MEISVPFGENHIPVTVPDGTAILAPSPAAALADPKKAMQDALEHPIGCVPFRELAKERAQKSDAKACIVVSDNTRPVPYRGEAGILMPLIRQLLVEGFRPENICILIATGTHSAMPEDEIVKMLGKEPFEAGVTIVNHDCREESGLCSVGTTKRGTVAKINRRYVEADLKILTGLVESHFMAGASGGRKSVCPGIFGEAGTFVFHGPELMLDPNSRDLNLDGNKVHEESLEVARLAGVDFIVNVTLDSDVAITGIFCGDLEQAHEQAVEKLKGCVGVPFESEFDLILTHAGFVGRNHYQAAKAGVEASYAVRPGGSVIMLANNHDQNPIGSDRYMLCCGLLKQLGVDAFERLLKSPDWTFLPDQWQVQMWAKLFKKIAMEDFIYYAPQLTEQDWRLLPGTNGKIFLRQEETGEIAIRNVLQAALSEQMRKRGADAEDVKRGQFKIAYLPEGPYAVPLKKANDQSEK